MPPRLARRQIPRVLSQLVLRMKLDLLLVALLCGITLALEPQGLIKRIDIIDVGGLAIMGTAVSILLAFRNTQAISRWWEARTLWGAVTNVSRHWRDCLHTLLCSDSVWRGEENRLVALQVLQVWLLNFELRGYWRQDAREAVNRLCASLGLPAETTLNHSYRARAAAIGRLRERRAISPWGRDVLLRCAESFTDAVGGLEKVRNTPLPPVYDVFIRLLSWIFGYAIFLDFTSNHSAITGILLFLAFLVAERVGAYVEGPFDRDGSSFSLPLDLICARISSDLLGPDHPLARLPLSKDPSLWT